MHVLKIKEIVLFPSKLQIYTAYKYHIFLQSFR